MLLELIVVCPPVGVVEVGGTIRDLLSGVARNVCRSALQVVLGSSTVNYVYDTIVCTRCRLDSGRAVVCRETSLPLLVDLPVDSTTSTSTHHARRGDDTFLISIADTE